MKNLDLLQPLVDALADALGARVQNSLRQVVRDELWNAPQDPHRLIDAVEAGKLLGMTPAAVRRAAERGRLPCTRVGRRLRFRVGDLMDRVGAKGQG